MQAPHGITGYRDTEKAPAGVPAARAGRRRMSEGDRGPIVVVLAAGMGSRFVIKSTFEQAFRERVLPRVSAHIATDYVLQDRDPVAGDGNGLPEGTWGTAHAVLVAGRKIDRPFAVINADDYYGRNAFGAARDALREQRQSASFCLISYALGDTLSPNGPVSRAICEIDGDRLLRLTEHTHVERRNDKARSAGSEPPETFDLATPVSMNFWGFTPDLLPKLDRLFRSFIRDNADDPQQEFRLPDAVHELLRAGDADVQGIPAGRDWFGMTYKADHEHARRRIEALIDAGSYPARLSAD